MVPRYIQLAKKLGPCSYRLSACTLIAKHFGGLSDRFHPGFLAHIQNSFGTLLRTPLALRSDPE